MTTAPSTSMVLWLTAPRGSARAFDLARNIAGLTMPLRLALTAQSAGCRAIYVDEAIAEVASGLIDPRLTATISIGRPDAALARIEVGADVVVHRGLFAALIKATADANRALSNGEGDARVLAIASSVVDASVDEPQPFPFAPAFGFQPIVVKTDDDARRATAALFRSLRKTVDGWTSTYMNRYVSLAVSRVLVQTSIHPNQLSVAILFIGLLSGAVASHGDYWSLVLGAALLHTQSVLDGCDGEIARVTFRGSLLGEWLDTVGDDLSNYGFFAGASYGLDRATGHAFYLVVGAVIVACGLLASALEYRYLARIGSGDLAKYPLGLDDEGGAPTTTMGKIVAGIRPLFKRDSFVFLTLIAALVGLLGPMLVIFAAGALGIVSAVVKAELRMANEPR